MLVALYDQKPVPKVIDFGVAKATNQQLTEKTLFTEVGSILGTWEYMSPEQAVLNQLDVDTRTDVYSLGVLLYELLTGETPLNRQRLREAQLLETLRMIREEEPPKPSTRISSLGERATAMAAYRRVKPETLASEIRGDLDWIVMKALAKERSRRYDSASRLGEDVERFLNHELVEARAPSTWYQLQKFYERNRVLVVSITAIIVALSLGLAVAIWGVREAVHQAVAARESESRAKDQEQKATGLLQQGKDLVIQQALLQAFAGRVVDVRKTVSEYKELFGNEEQWPSVLEAAAYMHNGQYETAQQILKPFVEEEITDIPAIALWSTSHVHQGKWNTAMESANRLRTAKPREGRAYILADIPGRKEQAMQIFRELSSEDVVMADRYNDVHIPLLLGEKGIAMSEAQKWVQEWEEGVGRSRLGMSEFREERLIKIIATGQAPNLQGSSRFERALVDHMLGLLALADGDRQSAQRHFGLSIAKPYTNVDHYWGEAFLEHLRKDDGWPREHRKTAIEKVPSE